MRALGSRHKRPYYVSISVLNASGIKQAALLVVTSELRSCVNVEVAVVFAPSLTVLTVSVDVEQHWNSLSRAQELCECRGGRRGRPIP